MKKLSELSLKAMELAEQDGWRQNGFGDYKRSYNMNIDGNICHLTESATRKELILMYRNEVNKGI